MVVALDHDQAIASQVLLGNVPGAWAGAFSATYAESLALPDGVEHQTRMFAQSLAVPGHDGAGPGRQVAGEKFPEPALPDETDAGTVRLGMVRQTCFVGDTAHGTLLEPAQGKQRLTQRRRRHALQEIGLILALVGGSEQSAGSIRAGVVARRHKVGPETPGVAREFAELDLPIAEHVRVGRPAGVTLRKQIGEDPLAIFAGEVHVMQGDTELAGYGPGVLQIARGVAVAVFVLFPVRHEEPMDVVATPDKQQSGHRGVDASRHADDDAL